MDKPEEQQTFLRDTKCQHYLERKSGSVVGCKTCLAHWIDNGKFVLENGLIKELASQ